MIKNKFFQYILLSTISLLMLLFSCKNNEEVDVTGIEFELDIKRFEQDLFETDLDSIPGRIAYLSNTYGDFFTKYNQHVIEIGNENTRTYPVYLTSFLTDYTMNKVYEKCQEVFPDLKMIEKKLTNAFKHFKYYYPGRTAPSIYTMISGFNQSVVVGKDYMGVSLDKYLGRKCDFYKRLNWPRYKVMKMYKEKIPADCIRAWALTEYEFNDSVNNVINNMIYHGKIIYYTKSMLPEEHDTLIFGFSNKQLEWCKNNESRMWTYLIDQKLLFNSQYMTVTKYINDGPYTPGFPRQSPGRATIWLGWKIVDTYMKRNKDMTLVALMENNNYQEILNQSKYNP